MAASTTVTEYPSGILTLLQKAKGTVAWTPPEELVEQTVDDFLGRVEPSWLEATIRRDPALYKHLDLKPADLAAFIEGKVSLQQLNIPKEVQQVIESEVKTYQGLHAIAFHKLAHAFYERAMEEKTAGKRTEAAQDLLLARQISQGVRRLTAGIEIHPGATIGKNFFIDHGAGVVIGETCEIGDDVFLYHGVTLGAASGKEVDEGKAIPRRHPKIGDRTVISTGVNILGPVTIGNNVSIGSDALILGAVEVGNTAKILPRVEVTKNIAPGAIVVGSLPNWPGLIDRKKGAGTPIIQPTPKTTTLPEWRTYLDKAIQTITGISY